MIDTPLEHELLDKIMNELILSVSDYIISDDYIDFLHLCEDGFLQDYKNIKVIYQRDVQ